MTPQPLRSCVLAVAVILMWLAVPMRALADPVTCMRGIADASAKHQQGLLKAMQKCEDAKVRGKLNIAIDCTTDSLFGPIRTLLSTKLAVAIARACGGANQSCPDQGYPAEPDDEPLGAIGWGSIGQCPNIGGASCTNAITSCDAIRRCLECINLAAVDQETELYYGAFVTSQFGSNSDVNRCQRALGKAAAQYGASRSKAMQKCWSARIAGQHTNLCPSPGDGKAALAISKAEDRKESSICKACGGPDRLCNGVGDLDPSAIGFAASCPSVTPPFGGSSCSGAIPNAGAIAVCVDCVTDFDTDCAGAASIPGILPLPSQCAPSTPSTSTSSSVPTTSSTSTSAVPTTSSTSSSTSTSTPASSTSSSSIAGTSTSTSTVLDTTTTSVAATTTTSTSSVTGTTFVGVVELITLTPSGVSGNVFRNVAGTGPASLNLKTGFLYLGSGDGSVPEGPTPDGGVNRFTINCTGTACTLGPTSTAGAGFECSDTGCKFGTPLPVVNSGLSTCVVNTFKEPVTGTLTNTTNGAVTLDVLLNSHTILTGDMAQPCPICRITSPGTGAACAGTPAAPCNGFCDRGANRTLACTSRNSQGLTNDCPPPNDVVGTQRCYGGTGDNNVCTSASTCGGGTCSQFVGDLENDLNPLTTGLAEKFAADGVFCPGQDGPGAFLTGSICDNTSGANSGLICLTDGGCAGGQCATRLCLDGTNDGKECSTAANCPGGTCFKIAELARDIRENGQTLSGSLLPAGTTRNLRLASVFCIPATTSLPVNGAADLPGPGATSLRSTLRILP